MGTLYPWVKCPSPPQPSCMLSFFMLWHRDWEDSLVIWSFWKPFKRILEPFLLSRPPEHRQNLPAAAGDTLPRGEVSSTPQPSCILSFFMIKGLRTAWLFEFSESPSRGYWKQFSYLILLNTVWIYLQQRGTLYLGVKCPHPLNPQPSCMLSFVCYDEGIDSSLVIWIFWNPSRGYWKHFLLSLPYEHNQNFQCRRRDTLPRGKVPPPPTLEYAFSFMLW